MSLRRAGYNPAVWVVGVAALGVSPLVSAGSEAGHESFAATLRLLDLARPDLATVKQRVEAGDWSGAAKEWLAYARARQRPRWYWTRGDRGRLAETIRERMPAAHRAALADAEEAMNHRFPHSCSPSVVRRVQLGPDFSFMDNPEKDRHFLFTLHRHVFWQEMGVAYLLTREERYAAEWARQLGRWLDELPVPPTDPGVLKHEMWYGLDVGIRAYRWAWAYFCFLDSPALTPELHARWLTHFAQHGWFLRHHHAPPVSNWCTMQMYGLLTVALVFPELKDSREWREYAEAKLVEAIRAQIRPDGVQVEQSPSYHVGCVSWFAEPMRLGELNGMTWPADYRDRLERMCEFTLWIMAPDGLLPALSDTDRSPFGKQALAVGAILFGRDDFATRAELTAHEVLVYGVDATTRFARLDRRDSPDRPARGDPPDRLRLFADSGYVVMRSGWDERSAFAVFDCGPRGYGHGHFDLLNLEVQALGKLLIADPGRWWYDESELRREMLSTPAHNAISLDGLNHSGFEGNPNREYEMGPIESRDGWTHVRGRHRAYDKLPGPPVCERHIWYDGAYTWIVVDEVDSPEPRDVLINYQFAEQPIERLSPSAVISGRAGQAQVVLLHEVRDGLSAALEPSTLSRVYGQKEPAVRLRLRQHGQAVRIVTVIHAFASDRAPHVALEVADAAELRVRLRVGEVSTRLHFSKKANTWSLRRGAD